MSQVCEVLGAYLSPRGADGIGHGQFAWTGADCGEKDCQLAAFCKEPYVFGTLNVTRRLRRATDLVGYGTWRRVQDTYVSMTVSQLREDLESRLMPAT
jgi:hypothetical protein